MKHFYLLPLALLVAACGNEAPSIDDLKEDSYPLVEQVLTEDDTDALSHRLDRYTLDKHPDELTYSGTAKVTEFKKTTAEDGTVKVDSTKYYVDVEINFHGTDYQQVLDELTARAKASPRLRMNLDLRNSPTDKSQRMLNAIEPGTVLPIHRHRTTSETVVCIRGHFEEYFYDVSGARTAVVDMVPGGNVLNIPIGWWHSLRSLESGTVLLEVKDGAYEPIGEEDILNG